MGIRTVNLTADNISIRSFGKIYEKCIVKVPAGFVEKYAIRLKDGGMPVTARIKEIKA